MHAITNVFRSSQRTRHQHGFTLVEIGVVVPILLVVAFLMFDILFAIIGSSTADRTRYELTFSKEAALSTIESDSVLTSSYLPTTDATVNDPYPTANYSGTWSYTGTSSTSRVLIMRNYSTTTNPLATTRQPVFIGDPSTSGASNGVCNVANKYFNNVQQYDVVYFVKNGNLYRRRLTDKTTLTCDSQYQRLSCPTVADLAQAGIGTRSTSCEADDELVVSDVSNFTVTYYNNGTALDTYANGADPALVNTATDADVTLEVTRKVAGQPTTVSSTLRMSKINSVKKSSSS